MGRLVVYGAGGFGREVLLAARAERRAVVLMADDAAPDFNGVPVIGFGDLRNEDEVVIAIADPAVRRRLAGRCARFGAVVAPTAIIGRQVEIGEGAIVCDQAVITASVRIGRHFHANVGAGVGHDCSIGDFVTMGPGARCNGNVHVGSGAIIASDAKIINGTPSRPLIIGEGATVGIGAVVVRSVPPYTTVFGNPARAVPRAVDTAELAQAPK
jgi:sugar O-acyltransferase (sialic acid O-acetyltransferase NeuD family)